MEHNYLVKTISNKDEYEGLRTLWCEVFSDEPSFVDAMYANFGEDIVGYIATDEEGAVRSALTCFKCGTFESRDVYTSYAICTAKEVRGLGLAGRLVEAARDDVLSKGGISLISPAEPSLEKFYGAHGYVPFFYVDKRVAEMMKRISYSTRRMTNTKSSKLRWRLNRLSGMSIISTERVFWKESLMLN